MASSSSTSSSTSTSLLPSEPLPWRPNTRPKLPPGALLDIDQGPLWDIFTEWLPFESVCHLDSALCQKSRRSEFLELLAAKVVLFNREEIYILTDQSYDYDCHHFTHRALGAEALQWILKRGIHLASLHPLSLNYISNAFTYKRNIHESVSSLTLNGHLDKLETISISECNYIRNAHLANILSKCYKSVKSIDIRKCDGLTKSAAAHIKRCTKLESFAAKGNESAADLAEIFKACRKLRKVDLSAFSQRLTDDVVLSVADNCPLLEHLALGGCSRVSDVAIRRIAESCPQLQFVDLLRTKIIDATVIALCFRCPHLKRMFLSECHKLTDATVLAVGERLPGLTHIDLSHIEVITSSAMETLASKCCELELIALSVCRNVSDATLVKISEHCPKLRKLRVSFCRHLTDAAVLAVAECLPGLTRIDLCGIEAITSSAVETLVSKCHELESIDLAYGPNVSDATLMQIAEHCSKLRELRVSDCYNLTDASVLAVAQKLSGLPHIYLDGIAEITSSAVETLANKCRELKLIDLSNCTNISDVTLTEIAKLCSELEDLTVLGCPNVTAMGLAEVQSKCFKLKSFEFDVYDEEDDVEEEEA